jgi:hypothetical protein
MNVNCVSHPLNTIGPQSGARLILILGVARATSESVLFIGTQLSNLYTVVDTPARAA